MNSKRIDKKVGNTRKTVARILAAVVVLAVIAGTLVIIFTTENTVTPSKTVYLDVINSANETVSYKLETDEIYLKEALCTDGFVTGEDSDVGFVIKSVTGITADKGKGEHWRLYKDGKTFARRMDKIKISDGDKYTLKLITE